MRYKNIDTVISDVLDWGEYKGTIDRAAWKKWANSLLIKMSPSTDLVDKVAVLNLKDYKSTLPEDLEKVVQLAYFGFPDKKIKRTEVVEWVHKLYDGSGCDLIISKECPKCHQAQGSTCTCDTPEVILDVDRLWELSHPEFKYNHMAHYYRHGGLTNENQVCSAYNPEFVLMKKSNHSFFNADSYIPGCLNLNTKLLSNNGVEYKLNDHTIEVNRKNGKILISYLASRTDSMGYRMIPDDEDVHEALKWYIIESIHFREIGKSLTQADRQHHKQMFQMASSYRKEAMGRAYETLNTPSFEDWAQFLNDNYFRVFKDQNVYEQLGVRTPDYYHNVMDRLTRHS